MDWVSLGLISGYAVAGAVIVWAGIAVGDEQRRFPIALQAVATVLAAVGLGAPVFAWRAQSRPAGAPSLTGSEVFILLLALAVFIALAALITFVGGAILNYANLRRARRRVEDPALASRLSADGPSEELIAAFAVRGVPPRVFWLAHVGDTLGARTQLALYATAAVIFPSALLGALILGYERGDLRWQWPPALDWVELFLVFALPVIVVYVASISAAHAARAWCIIRRSRRFPESAAYVYHATRCLPGHPIKVTVPYADPLADRVEAWSVRCQDAADRIMPLALLAGLILSFLAILDRSGVKRIF